MTVSYERAAMLIHIIKGAAELGPKDGNSISALAAMELKAMDDEARGEVAARTEKARQEAADKAAAEAEARAAQEAADAEEIAAADEGARPKAIPADKLPQAAAGRRL